MNSKKYATAVAVNIAKNSTEIITALHFNLTHLHTLKIDPKDYTPQNLTDLINALSMLRDYALREDTPIKDKHEIDKIFASLGDQLQSTTNFKQTKTYYLNPQKIDLYVRGWFKLIEKYYNNQLNTGIYYKRKQHLKSPTVVGLIRGKTDDRTTKKEKEVKMNEIR